MTNSKTSKNKRSFNITIIVLLLVGVLLVCGALLIRDNLIKNTHEYGQTLVKNYAAEEELNISNFKKQMELASFNLIELKGKGAKPEDIDNWFKIYKHKVSYIMGERISNYYGVIDGKSYSAVNTKKIPLDFFKSREWYKRAVKADGEPIFTGIYVDKLTGKEVTTIARKLPHSEDVLAMDMAVDNDIFENNISNFVDSASFYVYDNKERLFFYKTTWGIKGDVVQEYSAQVMAHIKKYGPDSNHRTMRDSSGEIYGIYYTEMDNGGTVVMIVPVADIMEGKKNIVLSIFVFIALVIFAIVTWLVIRNLKQRRNINNASSTIGLLGDMYYAIYRINLVNRTYECIKTTEELTDVLGKRGDYDFLIENLKKVSLNEDTDYIKKFNLDKVNRKPNAKFTYYGGEFKRRFGDEYKWVNIRIIQDGKLAVGESIWCFRMVDDEKKKELEHTKMLQDTLQNEEKKAKEKQEFFSKMSHDMRTPLNAIIGFSNLSHSFEDDSRRLIEYMDKIGMSARQLLTLINDILEYSKTGEKINKLNVSKFNIKDAIDDVEDSFIENAEREGKTISTKYDVCNRVVKGDSFKLVQILNNLISNSLKYSNSGDSISINVKQFNTGHHEKYQIVVEDTGIGMSQEFLKHIYEPYAREVQGLSKTETMGTGLGMLIVKNLVDIMNGNIYVESKLGVGTKVIVTLPFEIVDEAGVSEESETSDNIANGEDEQNQFFKGKRVLVAEDNELNMEIVIELLKMRGAKPTKAWDGKEAVEKFKTSEEGYYDCILMDMYMPVMDGCEATRQIRILDRVDSKSIPIIAVTANAFSEDIDKTTAAGMNGHVSKPLDFSALYKLMKKEVKNK